MWRTFLSKSGTILRILVTMAVGVAGTVVATRMLAQQVGSTAHLASVPEQPDIILEQLNSRSVVYDADGNELAILRRAEDRELVPLSKMPKQLQEAVVGIEDRNFYQHNGVNIRGTLRALVANTQSGDISQGGSTITQQLVKQSLLGTQQTVERKVKEAALAIRLEKQMPKDQILERYLNIVYLGNRAYGVQAASQTYFNKEVDQLQWPEIALLVSIIPNPTRYDPIKNPDTSKSRRALVAKRLRQLDVITPDIEETINAAPLPTTLTPVPVGVTENQTIGTNYFVEEVKRTLIADPQIGEDLLYKGGLKVYTTFDPKAQGDAEEAVRAKTPDTGGRFVSALAAVEPGSGRVKALVGGPLGGENQFNAATQEPGRQPGSSFKPFVLATAFSQGQVPNDIIDGTGPCSFPNPGGVPNPYTVSNYDGSSGATTSLQEQTVKSSNCAFVRLGRRVGLGKVVDFVGKLGITGIDTNISMPLGTEEVTPMKMAAAYAAFVAVDRHGAGGGPVCHPGARGQRRAGHRHQGSPLGTAGGRQNRYHPGLRRRLVRRLFALHGHCGVDGQPQDQPGQDAQRRRHSSDRRYLSNRDLAGVHDQAARRSARGELPAGPRRPLRWEPGVTHTRCAAIVTAAVIGLD